MSAVNTDTGTILEALNDKLDRDMENLDTATQGPDVVIDWQLPTAANGYTWYRKYKSGWVEQGGAWLSASAAYNTYVVTLPITMQNTNYYANAIISYTGSDCWGAQVSEKTISTVTFTKVYNSLGLANWEIKGMAAA